MKFYRANGKLLIAGEYTVLDGGLSFAVPTKLGQTLEVGYLENSENPTLIWEAFLEDKSLWFSAEFELKSLEILNASNDKLAQKLKELFEAVEKINPNFFKNQVQNVHCKTRLEFPKQWGLGSSSTLIYLLAKFAQVDEFELSDLTFRTSGYDVACASQNSPILYQITESTRRIEPIKFNPEFLNQLHFIYLNQKQDTQTGVSKQYKSKPKKPQLIDEISILTQKIVEATSLNEFESYVDQHEELLSRHLEVPKVKDLYFSDYGGIVKSLGAWGGDFVMVTARENFKEYFKSKGYTTIFPYKKIMIQN